MFYFSGLYCVCSCFHVLFSLCLYLCTCSKHSNFFFNEKSVKSYDKSNVDYRDDDLVNNIRVKVLMTQ